MNSMQQLNGFGNTAVVFTDDRSQQIAFSGTGNAAIFAKLTNANVSYPLPQKRSIVTARSINDPSTYRISNRTSTTTIVDSGALPADVTRSAQNNNTTTVYSGPLFAAQFDQICTHSLRLPANFNDTFTMTSNIRLGGSSGPANSSASYTTAVVFPFSTVLAPNNAWSFVNGANTQNSADNFSVTMSVAGSMADPYTGATVNLGTNAPVFGQPGAVITSESITQDAGTGNAVVSLSGRFDNPISGNEHSVTPLSTRDTTVTLQTASGSTVAGLSATVPLKVSVDGVRQVRYAGGPFVGASRSEIFFSIDQFVSGISSQFPVNIDFTWPELVDSGIFYQVWLRMGHVLLSDAEFTALTPSPTATMEGGQRVQIMSTNLNPGQRTRTVTANAAFGPLANFVFPSSTVTADITVTLLGSLPVTVAGNGFLVFSKPAVNVNNVLRSASTNSLQFS